MKNKELANLRKQAKVGLIELCLAIQVMPSEYWHFELDNEVPPREVWDRINEFYAKFGL